MTTLALGSPCHLSLLSCGAHTKIMWAGENLRGGLGPSASEDGDVLGKSFSLPALNLPFGGKSLAGPQPQPGLIPPPDSLCLAPFLCWSIGMGAQLDAVCCVVGGIATRVQCLLTRLWPPVSWGCPPALWDTAQPSVQPSGTLPSSSTPSTGTDP